MKSFKTGDILKPISHKSYGVDLEYVTKVRVEDYDGTDSDTIHCILLDDIEIYDHVQEEYIEHLGEMIVYASDFELYKPKTDTYEIF